MEKLISVAVMRASDAAEIAGGTDSKTLMYRAGLGLFQSWDWHGKIDIVTGSGNNAGDGYVLALLLRQHGIPCRIVRTSEKVSPDGGYFFAKCEERGIPVTDSVDFSHTDILVDCLLGTGFRGELRPSMRHIVEQINQSGAAVLRERLAACTTTTSASPARAAICLCSPETTGLRNRGTSFRQSPFHKFWTISTFLPVNRHNAYKCWRIRSGRRCSFSP